jgi:arylsulfatase A-like enzyme
VDAAGGHAAALTHFAILILRLPETTSMKLQRFLSRRAALVGFLAFTCLACAAAVADEPNNPNILVIFGDDIGWFNVSSYSGDLMGVPTPNIDRIGKEGLPLSAFYAQPSCTAGRAAFITGQLPVRTGLTTVGTPGSPAGLQKEDITLAEVLKTKGYATAQFGKNHLGDLEDYRVAFRKKIYGSISELQSDLDDWVKNYNEERPHQGRWCFGKTPMQTFLDATPLAKEKMIADPPANRPGCLS